MYPSPMRSSNGIKPQDILILLKLATWKDRPDWKGVDLAKELGLSPFEVSIGLERCRRSGFLDASKRGLMRSALQEFLIHGLKYSFPTEPGAMGRGMPTAHSAPPLARKIVSNEPYVWPDDEGRVRGQAIEPLYPSAPSAAKSDAKLYELLALIDTLRVGRAREQKMAIQEIEKRIGIG